MKMVIIYNEDEMLIGAYTPRDIRNQPGVVETAEAVAAAALERGTTLRLLPLRDDLEGFIKALKEDHDIIFNLCEGAFGLSTMEMNVAALLELLGIRFTGSGSITLGLCLNKAKTKEILYANGIPTPRFFVISDFGFRISDLKKQITSQQSAIRNPQSLSFPLIVKPLQEDASLGIDDSAVVADEVALKERVEYILKVYHQPALVEEYIDGREFNISILGNDNPSVLPISEIDYSHLPEGLPKICGYEAKWVPTSPLYLKTPPICPAPVSKELEEELSSIALRAYRALDCRDYARVDIRMGEDGVCKVLEVNPNPDISPDAGFARSARVGGLDYGQLIQEIVRLAIERYEG